MKLLLIEDETDLANALAKALREEDYAVDLAEEGVEGLYKAVNSDHDAIILDVMLPGLDGWDLLQRLRRVKNTAVLMLTARDQTVDHVHGLDLGADDYLVKPFELSELLARIRSLIRRNSRHNSSTIEIGDITINTAARLIIRDGNSVPLTAREYALVEYLARHRREVITRTTLYEHLFDENVMTVADTGQGISESDLPHIFERFFRADKSRTGSSGRSGLGLAISKGIIEAHKGRFEVKSKLGVGTTFTVRLPG